jgi:hypothetical protein
MKSRMLLALLATVSLLATVPLPAVAGKAERDFVSKEVEPAIQASGEKISKTCGCALKIDLKIDGFTDVDQLRNARNFVRAVGDGAAGHCTDAPSKAAVCKMKTLEVSRGTSVSFKFAGGKGTATTDVSSYPSWDMIAAQVDK